MPSVLFVFTSCSETLTGSQTVRIMEVHLSLSHIVSYLGVVLARGSTPLLHSRTSLEYRFRLTRRS